MKKLILIFGLTLLYLMPWAQEKTQTMPDVEQFCKAQGRVITGYLIYKDTYGVLASEVTAMVMKYVDAVTKDSMLGVTFSCSIKTSFGDCSVYKSYETMLDYEEISKIISWLESYRWIVSSADSKIGYLSYTPQKGNLLLKLQRRMSRTGTLYSSNYWDFSILFNKYDADSEKSFVMDFETLLGRLKEIQRMMEK